MMTNPKPGAAEPRAYLVIATEADGHAHRIGAAKTEIEARKIVDEDAVGRLQTYGSLLPKTPRAKSYEVWKVAWTLVEQRP